MVPLGHHLYARELFLKFSKSWEQAVTLHLLNKVESIKPLGSNFSQCLYLILSGPGCIILTLQLVPQLCWREWSFEEIERWSGYICIICDLWDGWG